MNQNDGETPFVVTAKDVPVDAFWSVTVYNAAGYLEGNELGIHSYNDVTATPNEDGSHTVHFGGCEDGRINCVPISPAGITPSGCTFHGRIFSKDVGCSQR